MAGHSENYVVFGVTPMLFSSFEFIFLFLPITLFGYFLWGKKSVHEANVWLLVASFFFYAWWDVRFLPLLLASILANFLIGLALGRFRFKKIFLIVGIAVNLGFLGFFKYADFFIQTMNRAFRTDWNFLHLVLPLGISFYTFQAISYIADVYLGRTNAEKSLVNLALYISLFPQLIAGPIVDHKMMIPQFSSKERHRFNAEGFSAGITLFSLALFKKVVIADSLSPVVADIFGRISSLSMLDAWVGVISYSFQLYFDFSAYSEMAIGLGKMLGFDFPTNFDSPYQATSVIDFWRRWHITLGSWIRNYIYIPLGGNRKGGKRKMLNLFVAMTLCGFWHGAGFRYIAWGMMHGGFLVVNHWWRKFSRAHTLHLPRIFSALLTFGCVTAGWAVFRAPSLRDGLRLIKRMLNFHRFALPAGGKIENLLSFLHYFKVQFVSVPTYPFAFLLLLSVLSFCFPSAQKIVAERFRASWKWLFATLAALFYSLYTMAGNANLSEFLYFQF